VLLGELKAETLALALRFFVVFPEGQVEYINSTDESDALVERYVAAGVISENHLDDCMHIATATVFQTIGIVSTNLRDMVKRAAKYNRVNMDNGYPEMRIVTPDKYKELLQKESQ
jgi:hypothetical protein